MLLDADAEAAEAAAWVVEFWAEFGMGFAGTEKSGQASSSALTACS